MYNMTSFNEKTGIYYIPDNVANTAFTTANRRIALAQYFKVNAKLCFVQTDCLPDTNDFISLCECEETVNSFGTITEEEFDTALMDMFIV